jgi:2-keto-4-pentenoate hydratase/2-oxohepta-3-ene-1,7-dioic acid hydratase in catechol pathway
MKLVRFLRADGTAALGVATARGVLDVAAAARQLGVPVPVDPVDFYAAGLEAMPALSALVAQAADDALYVPEVSLPLQSPLPCEAVQKVLCVGLNYRRHAEETGAAIPTSPILFSKFSNALAGPGEPVPLPRLAEQNDYEAELVVVIGRRARYVSEAAALDYVLGYTAGDDVSARDLQLRTSQWLLGKTPDKFLPVGPYLVTTDEIPDPQALDIRGWLNGELRQNSNTADMIFTVAQVIAYVSQYFPLEPGDLIATGTPEGVILGMKDKVWLKPGDTYTVEIDGLGRLENTFVEEQA